MKAKYTDSRRTTSPGWRTAGLLAPLVIGAMRCTASSAASLPVANCNDAGAGSLRAAVAAAHSGDVIDLTQLACSKISLSTGTLITAVTDLTLRGPGADQLTIEGTDGPSDAYAVIRHGGNGTLHIESLRISNSAYYSNCLSSGGTISLNASTVTRCSGAYAVIAANGASIRYSEISENVMGIDVTAGNVSIRNSTIADNSGWACSAMRLGRIGSVGSIEISGSTISGNQAGVYGGGGGCLFMPATIVSSTIVNNRGNDGPPGILTSHVPVVVESSILANNVSVNSTFDLMVYDGTLTGHHNLIMSSNKPLPADTIRADPQLLPLADNGGPTRTHALAATSPAIDAGSNSTGLVSDQRGNPFVRVAGAGADIGAFETQATPLLIGPGFTGSWYDPNQSGQGLTIEVLSGKRLYATWFAFDPNGKQAWFTGVGTYDGNTATIAQVLLPQGARWIPNFNKADIIAVPWGSLTFTFSDCDHGRVDFTSTVSGFGTGHMDLTRLTQPAGLACP